jgi:hypothetical protein
MQKYADLYRVLGRSRYSPTGVGRSIPDFLGVRWSIQAYVYWYKEVYRRLYTCMHTCVGLW